MVERRLRLLLAFENAQVTVQALLFERVELDGEVTKRIASHKPSVYDYRAQRTRGRRRTRRRLSRRACAASR